MRLAFKIAIRFLSSGKGQTILIALGIAVGVSVQVFIGSLIQGLQIGLVDTTIGNASQITITSESKDKTIKDWERAVYESKLSSNEIKNISVAADGAGFVEGENENFPVLIRGFNIKDADKIYDIESRLKQGAMPYSKEQTVIGIELAEKLGVKINDKIQVTIPGGGTSKLTVTGIFDLKVSALNKNWVVTNLETAQNLLGLDNKVTSVEMQVNTVFAADETAKTVIYNVSEKDLKVDNWKDQNSQLLSGLNGQSVSSYMIQVFVLIAVLLGISSVLAISVVQRSKQLGILKAMGIKDRDASLIFVFQGMMLGTLGAVLGIALGFGLLTMFTKFAVNGDGSPVVPIYINYQFIALSGFFALASAMIASVIPARLSSRLNPIEVIKNG